MGKQTPQNPNEKIQELREATREANKVLSEMKEVRREVKGLIDTTIPNMIYNHTAQELDKNRESLNRHLQQSANSVTDAFAHLFKMLSQNGRDQEDAMRARNLGRMTMLETVIASRAGIFAAEAFREAVKEVDAVLKSKSEALALEIFNTERDQEPLNKVEKDIIV